MGRRYIVGEGGSKSRGDCVCVCVCVCVEPLHNSETSDSKLFEIGTQYK